MSILDKKTGGDLVKLLIFIVVTTMATGVLVILIGNLSFTSTRDYKAVFSDATGVVKGDDIRIAGCQGRQRHGRRGRGSQEARWSPSTSPTTRSSPARPRRSATATLSASANPADPGRRRPQPAAEDATIPMERTQPALDLTVLFNGFKPLFKALSPTDVNKLSAEVISVFQGEGGNSTGCCRAPPR